MKRFLAAVCALALLGLGSAGCNTSSISSIPASAAHVGGSDITTASLDAAMEDLQADSGYLCQGGAGVDVVTAGVGTNTWNATFADYVLTQLVKYRILTEMVDARHLGTPLSDANLARAEAENAVAENLSVLEQESVTCQGTPETIIDGLGTSPSSFGAALISNQIHEDVYSAYLAGTSLQTASLASWERAHPASTTQSCTSVIGVASESLAIRIQTAVLAGSSFAAEANRYSQNTGAGRGGVVGCVLESQWTGNLGPVVAALKVGVVSRPVRYENGWLLFEVTKRQLEPTADVIPAIDQLELPAFEAQYSEALAAAEVTVSPAYGSVERKAVKGGYTLAIVPPSDKACAYALSAGAAGCPATSTSANGSSG
ncbi:MAG TPA: peptidylprolyl isomerase [Acidimicrobiales bacterium]|nr:peptidylprolyl isomerase [Acidimicrobiales bacterium]